MVVNQQYEIIGRSTAIEQVRQRIRQVAASDVNVLITGESGTGKELVARMIHALSRRSNAPFVPVNCSALPEHLFEAELFGYEKGAFTGATHRKIGLLEFANSGTFFLDEVCEMPHHLQAKLLRVLQDGHVRRLGGNKLYPVDIRVLSATNRKIEEALQENLLREDLLFRINVVNIHVPPLRERREDIPLLAEYFMQIYLKSSQKKITGFSSDVLDAFERYAWPGNVRELENVIEHAITFARGDCITLADLPGPLQGLNNHFSFINENLTLPEIKRRAIEEVERRYLLRMLSRFHGNVSRIAEAAGVDRRSIHRMLRRHGIHAQEWRNHRHSH